ncbi:hypothetical protein VCRA2116O29_890002 [Vibrio crassostreae]|nr:hypothetical protein VCRA2116O29_890002 [Vibrio crassostreae]CAK2572287.1 hypothetical protein VCRA2119O48_840002 [Vibrio crassostreae]CAK3073364.1 hypothetical protein VCRA2133E348_620001 [Vibrio crassostreae]CAK3588093.1 hypothetical protein VCRA213O314_650001 [Vibrio crassostreae]CAK4028391.1 hypothetical protein VCRA212O16_900011 [Vibrio crassostreae]
MTRLGCSKFKLDKESAISMFVYQCDSRFSFTLEILLHKLIVL